ncbi:MAG: DUF2273 domain-containing protein [Spirochaetes bacterium]|jgi:uncharacterized membrane protein|nr:DUF2273 domain-containing protein [Spirochaetota bacterium]
MNQIFQHLRGYFTRYPGRSYGASAGFLIGVLLLTLGFKKTLFITLVTLFGFIVGFLIDINMRIPGLSVFNRSKPQDDELHVYYEDDHSDGKESDIE